MDPPKGEDKQGESPQEVMGEGKGKQEEQEEGQPKENVQPGPSGAGRDPSPREEKGGPKRPLKEEEEGESGAEETVTMEDVLRDAADLEENAKAVLGGADEKNCTYLGGGYMKRQPLYSCLTCIPAGPAAGPAGSSRGGVCLACSYHCHEGHELVELYTKRNFRCDCGNASFPEGNPCKLDPDKAPRNEQNKYNQNFQGVYCTCHRPYPDPEDPVSDEMIQCVVCEDWYHGRHLGLEEGKTPRGSSYAEMICRGCVADNPFLTAYRELDCGQEPESVEVEKTEGENQKKPCPLEVLERKDSEKQQGEEKTAKASPSPSSLFLVSGWREHLCRCAACAARYAERRLEFLLDPEDTVHHYEEKSKDGSEKSQYEEGMKALSEMERTQQVEAIQSYNQMKGNLMEYLRQFANDGKVVTQEDITAFFQDMQAAKRRKVEIPKFCR